MATIPGHRAWCSPVRFDSDAGTGWLPPPLHQLLIFYDQRVHLHACLPIATQTHPTMLCHFRSTPFPPFLSVDDCRSMPAYPAVHLSTQQWRPSHRHHSTSDRPGLQAMSLVDVVCYRGAAPAQGHPGCIWGLSRQKQIVILRYCSIYRQSDLFDCEKKAFFSVLGLCIVLPIDVNG